MYGQKYSNQRMILGLGILIRIRRHGLVKQVVLNTTSYTSTGSFAEFGVY